MISAVANGTGKCQVTQNVIRVESAYKNTRCSTTFSCQCQHLPAGPEGKLLLLPAVSTVQGRNETLETPNRQGSSGINVQKRTREISVVSSNAGTHVGLQPRFKQRLAGENIQTRHWPKMLKQHFLKVCHSAHLPKWTWKSRVHSFAGCLGCRLSGGLRNPSLFRRRRRFHPEDPRVRQWQPTIEQRWQPRHGSMLHGTEWQSQCLKRRKKKGAKNKRSTNTDFYIGCFQSTSSHINTNFEWCCDCVFKSISWPKNLVSDAAKQCNKSTWMNCLLEGSQIQNILIYSWTTCVVFMRFFCFQKGVLLRHRPSSLGPRWREGHNLEPLRGKQRHHAFFSTEPQQQSSMEHEGCWLPGILTMALL